jgi:hypothetical protein
MENLKYKIALIIFIENFVELNNFRKTIINSNNIKISETDVISINRADKDPWDQN